MRVLKWIVQRANGQALGHDSPLGWVPQYDDLDWRGLPSFTREDFDEIMSIEPAAWKHELMLHEELFVDLYDRLPTEMQAVRNLLLSSLWRIGSRWEHASPSIGS